MSNRLTLLLITQSQLARIDVAGGKSVRVKDVWTRDRIPGESIATLTDAAIRLGPDKTGDVWVFSSEFWTGEVQLAGDVAAALGDDELEQAIALEAETFSGVGAFDSRLGLKPLPKDAGGDARWWVTQIPQSDWHEVNQVIQQFRGKLAGMGHAALAGFPTVFGDKQDDSDRRPWRLNQAFGETTVSINGVGNDISEVITFGDLKTQRTQSQLLDWCDETERPNLATAWVTDQRLPEELVVGSCPRLSLAPDGIEDAIQAGESETGSNITGESAFRHWAETMAVCLRGDRNADVRMPIAVAHKPPMSNHVATFISCALGLLIALGCFAIHTTTAQQLADLNSDIDRFNRTKKALASDKQTLIALKKELNEKQETLAELKTKNQSLENDYSEALRIRHFQQTRWVKLVGALAKANEGGCWVRALESQGQVVKVQGIALSNQEISVFATNLEKYASPHGWRVHPAQTERNEMALVDFEVTLDISDLAAPVPQVGSSWARANSAISLVAAPIQSAPVENTK